MSESLTVAQQLRCAALEAARCAFSDRELSTGGFLSSASQFETYLVTGLVRTGGRFQSAVEVGAEGVSVTVEAPGLDSGVTERLRVAVAGVLGQPHPFLCDRCGKPFMSKECGHVQPARGVVR